MPDFTKPSVPFPQLGPWSKKGGSAPKVPSTPTDTGGGGSYSPGPDRGTSGPAPVCVAPSFDDLPSTGTGAGISVGSGADAASGGIWDRIRRWLPSAPSGEGGGPFFNPTPPLPSFSGSGGGTSIEGASTDTSMSNPYTGMYD